MALIDTDGKSYFFNSTAFNEKIKAKATNIVVNGKKQKQFQYEIRDNIAEKCFVTDEAVKKWQQGYNGPSEIKQVKLAAEVLEIDYHLLLSPVLDDQEVSSVNSKSLSDEEKELIRNTYTKLLSYFYDYYSLDGIKRRNKEISLSAARKTELEKISEYINTFSFTTSEKVRNKLQRIIIESADWHPICDRWNDVINSFHIWFAYCDHYCYETKKELIEDCLDFSKLYICDEIDMAEALELDCSAYYDEDEFYNTDGKSEEEIVDMRMKMGPSLAHDLEPYQVYKREMCLLLIDVFTYDFPEMKGELHG